MTRKIIIFCILFLLLFWVFNRINARKQEEKNKLRNIKRNIEKLAQKYDAISEWNNFLNKKVGENKPIYLIDIQKILIYDYKKPIVIFGYLIDVGIKNDKFFVFLDTLEKELFKIRFILEIEGEKATNLLNINYEDWDKFVVIANIHEIRRPNFEIKESLDDESNKEIYVEPSNLFIAYGKLLDYIWLNKYEIK